MNAEWYYVDMLDKSKKAKHGLCLLSDLHHLWVSEVLLHEEEFELLPVDEEGHYLEKLTAKHGVKLDDLFVGTAKDHSLEASFLHLLIDHGDVVDPVSWFQLLNSVESSPTRIDVFSLLEGLEIHCLDQFFPFSFQIAEKRDLWLCWGLSALDILSDLHVKSSSCDALVMDKDLIHPYFRVV